MKGQRYALLSPLVVVACAFRLSADLGGPLVNDSGLDAGLGDTTGAPADGVDDAADDDSPTLAEVLAVSVDANGVTPGWAPSSEASAAIQSDGTGSGPNATDGSLPADLPPPPTGAGLQLVSPANAFVLQPGQEVLQNYCETLSENIQVGGFDSWMSQGGHHFFVYVQTASSSAPSTCTQGAAPRLYAHLPTGIDAPAAFPAGVGLPLAQNTEFVVVMHFINPFSFAVYPQIKLNILFATNVQYEAGIMLGTISGPVILPPATPAGPTSQSVSGSCTVPSGSKFFLLTAYGATASVATIDLVSGGASTEILSNAPPPGRTPPEVAVTQYASPNFLAMGASDSFSYQCSFSNSTFVPVTVGTTSEACSAVGLYFPAGTAQCQ